MPTRLLNVPKLQLNVVFITYFTQAQIISLQIQIEEKRKFTIQETIKPTDRIYVLRVPRGS